MPIQGRTLHEAAQKFCDHCNRVLARTVTETRLVVFEIPPRVQVAFRQAGRPIAARLQTRFGPMGLYLGQVCESVMTEEDVHRLRTIEYKYTLTPEGADEPLLRWEYIRTPPLGAQWCRHHLQGPVILPVPGHAVSLNDLHLPTGYVPLEEVLRCCITDFEVPPLSDEWDKVLLESYELFRMEFVR
jgi:hypothetical protein